MGGSSPTSGPVNPLTGASGDSGMFGGLGPIGLQPMQGAGALPTQQQFQQQGPGIQFPAGNFSPAGMARQQQQNFVYNGQNVGPNHGLGMSHGTHWNGNPANYAGGSNNWDQPTNWEKKSNPGPVDQATLDHISKSLGNMRGYIGDVRQDVRAGTRDPRALDLMGNRMANLRDYAQFMRGNAAPGTNIHGVGRGGAGAGAAADPFAPGVASDFTGGLTNSAALMKLLAKQGNGAL